MLRSQSNGGQKGQDATAEEPTLEGVFAADGVDLTVIRWMLRLTPTERLEAVQDLVDAAATCRPLDES